MSRFFLFFFCFSPFLACMWYATESFAGKVQYDVQFLGEAWFGHIYAPWSIFRWYSLYNPYVPDLLTAALPTVFLGAVLSMGCLFLCKPKQELTSHGSAHWASYQDMLKMDLISAHGCVIGLYDNPMTKFLTSILRSVENKKKEKVSFAEMDYDQRINKKIDKEESALAKLRGELEGMTPKNPKYEKTKKSIEVKEKWLDSPPKYDAKRDNPLSVYPYVWLYKKLLKTYVKIPHFYLRDNSNKHLAVIAPTRSGKGVGLIVPTLLGGWTESCIVNDIKSENWGITAGFRKKMGQKVIKFEPTSDDGSTARWNPLDEIPIGSPMEVSMAQNLAAIIADYEGKGKPDHWTANAANVIMAVILHLKYAHFADPKEYPRAPNLYSVAAFLKANSVKEEGSDEVDVKGFTDTIDALQTFHHVPPGGLHYTVWDTKTAQYVEKVFTVQDLRKTYPDSSSLNVPDYAYTHPIVFQAFSEILTKPDNELGSIVSTANTALKEYLDPVLASNTSVSDFCIDDLMNYKKPVSLYLVTPPSDLLRLAPIFRLFFEMMVRHHARSIGTYENGQAKTLYKHKCLFLMDEFSSLGNLQSFAATLSYIAGYGMKVFLINQGLPQINGIYGKDNQILMNCHLQIFYAPNDNDTGKYAESLLGNKTIVVDSISDSGGFSFKKNYSHSQTGRALLTADELKRLGDQEIIVASGSPPVLTDKIKYYENNFFLKKLYNAPVVSDVIREPEKYPEFNANPAREALLKKAQQKDDDSYLLKTVFKTAGNAIHKHKEGDKDEKGKDETA